MRAPSAASGLRVPSYPIGRTTAQRRVDVPLVHSRRRSTPAFRYAPNSKASSSWSPTKYGVLTRPVLKAQANTRRRPFRRHRSRGKPAPSLTRFVNGAQHRFEHSPSGFREPCSPHLPGHTAQRLGDDSLPDPERPSVLGGVGRHRGRLHHDERDQPLGHGPMWSATTYGSTSCRFCGNSMHVHLARSHLPTAPSRRTPNPASPADKANPGVTEYTSP